jgi:hypothetical protein
MLRKSSERALTFAKVWALLAKLLAMPRDAL